MGRPTKNKSSLDNNVLFTIYGMEIRENSLYEINSKYDPEAPDGFQANLTTKILNEAVVDVKGAATWNSSIGAWDTGLTENSALLRGAFPNETERKVVLAKVKEKILDKYESIVGKDTLRATADNNDFWDKYLIRVGNYTIFNTAKVEELYQLYMLLLKKEITPKKHEKNQNWAKSAYIVVDKEELISREEERDSKLIGAYSAFAQLVESKDIQTVLDWLGIRVQDSTTNSVKTSVFRKFVENPDGNYKNLEDFNLAVEMFTDENKKEIFGIHDQLKNLYKRNEGVFLRKGEIYLQEEYIGNSFKVAAQKVYSDKELRNILLSLL